MSVVAPELEDKGLPDAQLSVKLAFDASGKISRPYMAGFPL